MQKFNCIAYQSARCRVHRQRLPRLQIEFATSNTKKKIVRKKKEKKRMDHTALKPPPRLACECTSWKFETVVPLGKKGEKLGNIVQMNRGQ